MAKRKQSLSEKLAELADPTPKFTDPENDNEDTFARVEDYDEDLQQSASTQKLRKNLRHLATPALTTDLRYAGKPVSRKSFMQESESDDSCAASEDGEDIDEDDLAAFRYKLTLHKKKALKDSYNEDEDEESDEEEDEEEEEDENDEDGEDEAASVEDEDNEEEVDDEEGSGEESDDDEGLDEDDEEEESSGLKTFSSMNFDSELQKGQAVRNQLGIWDALLEIRIKCQKVLLSTNQLPPPETYPLFNEHGDKAYKTALSTAKESLRAMLDDLLELQTNLLAANPQTSYIVTGKEPQQDGSDEEIPSDTEDEEEKATDVKPPKKRQKLSEYGELLQKRHDDFKKFRNQVLTLWNEKTRLGTGKNAKSFAAFEQPILTQINNILADRHRLIHRTRIQRSAYRILGKQKENVNVEEKPVDGAVTHEEKAKADDDEEPEIFDDDDFYHQLLRELIERKTMDNSDPISMGRQWLEIQRMRAKAKRKVDTKASKGRKLRYDVHQKLVSFMAPHPDTEWTDAAKNDLFASLFGKSGDRKAA